MDDDLRLIVLFGASGLLGIVVCAVVGAVVAARTRTAHGLRPGAQMPPYVSQGAWRRAGLLTLFFGLLWCVMVGVHYRQQDLAIAGLIGFVVGVMLRTSNQEHDPDESRPEDGNDF